MQGQGASFFDGLSAAELVQIHERLEHRRFPTGVTVLAEGDAPRELYIIQSGAADVFIADRNGREHLVGRAGPGASLGEMSVFTGQPASATVRATADLDVLVLSEAEFHRTAAAFPRIYRNLGAILSDRLARSNRRSLRDAAGRVVVLLDAGAPPLLGYALACSVAWHTRAPTLLLVLGAAEPAAELVTLAAVPAEPRPRTGRSDRPGEIRAAVMLAPAEGAFAPGALPGTLEELSNTYDHVLVQVRGETSPPSVVARAIRIAGMRDPEGVAAGGRLGLTLRGWADRRRLPRPDGEQVLRVPELTPADEQALRTGMLPASTPAGRSLGWAARELTGLKVGLALGAGSLRGYAHVGVLDVLTRAGVPVDYIVGTSIGSAVAALWATGHNPAAAARVMDELGAAAFRPTVPTTSILSSAGLRAGVRKVAGEARIEELRMPLAIVAADIVTRQEVVFRRGLVWPAVLASMSIPGVYPPQRMGRYMLVDGGILNPVPSNVAADMGADTVIAVRLGGRPTPRGPQIEAAASSGRMPSVIQAITRSIETMQSKITADTAAAATILLETPADTTAGWGLRNFSAGRRYIAEGVAVAEAALPRIEAALPWVRPTA